MTPAPPVAANAQVKAAERVARELVRAKAESALPQSWTPDSFTKMGHAKASSQMYNAGALFTTNALASTKG